MELPEARAVGARPFYTTLYFRVLVAIALGGAVGAIWPTTGAKLAVLGEGSACSRCC